MESDRETLQIEVVAENADRSGVYFTVLDLPAMGGRIWDALQRLRSTATPERPFDVSIRESPKLPELAGITLIAPTLPELNFFARRLAFMPDEDILLLKGVFLQRLEAGRYENGMRSIAASEWMNSRKAKSLAQKAPDNIKMQLI